MFRRDASFDGFSYDDDSCCENEYDESEEELKDSSSDSDEYITANQHLIRRKKAPLQRRQKKWADTFNNASQMREFVVRELISNATDAILRLAKASSEGNTGRPGTTSTRDGDSSAIIHGFCKSDGKIDISVGDAGGKTVLLEVTDNGEGCADFAKAIMTEGTTVNSNMKKSGVTTGGKGSAKDCFSVQDGFSFISKVPNGRRRYFAGSQDLALEHVQGCTCMDLKLHKNRGPDAEDRLEAMSECSCAQDMGTEEYDTDHGTTVTLALAPIITGTAKKNSLNSRLRSIENTVKKVIEYTAGLNSELDGIQFTLNGSRIEPLLHLESVKGIVEANRGMHKTKFSKFNKDLECYKASFYGSSKGMALLAVVAETGMYQFHKLFPTNHQQDLVVVIKCKKSCKQLDANRSRFRSDGHQDVLEELKRRMVEVYNFRAVMDPVLADLDPEDAVDINGEVSSTNPIGALQAAEITIDEVRASGFENWTNDRRNKLKKAIQRKKAQFAKEQSRKLTRMPIAIQGHIPSTDPRALLAKHTSQHIDYVIKKGDCSDQCLDPPMLYGTKQQTRIKLYRIYCAALAITHEVRNAAHAIKAGSGLCSDDCIVRLEIRDDVDGKKVEGTHSTINGKCVIGINLLQLMRGSAELRYDYKDTDTMQKHMLSLLSIIIHEVAHCVTCEDHNSRFIEALEKIRGHLERKGVSIKCLSTPAYVKEVCMYAKKLTIERVPKRKETKPSLPSRRSSRIQEFYQSDDTMSKNSAEDDCGRYYSDNSEACFRWVGDGGSSYDGGDGEERERNAEISTSGCAVQGLSSDNLARSEGAEILRNEDKEEPGGKSTTAEATICHHSETNEKHHDESTSHADGDEEERERNVGSSTAVCTEQELTNDNLTRSEGGAKRKGKEDKEEAIEKSKTNQAAITHQSEMNENDHDENTSHEDGDSEEGGRNVERSANDSSMQESSIDNLVRSGGRGEGQRNEDEEDVVDESTSCILEASANIHPSESNEKNHVRTTPPTSSSPPSVSMPPPIPTPVPSSDASTLPPSKAIPSTQNAPPSSFDQPSDDTYIRVKIEDPECNDEDTECTPKRSRKRRRRSSTRFSHNKNKSRVKRGIMHHLHEHPLYLSKDRRKLADWRCDNCTPEAKDGEEQQFPFTVKDNRYRCALSKRPICDFDLCESCFQNNHLVKKEETE